MSQLGHHREAVSTVVVGALRVHGRALSRALRAVHGDVGAAQERLHVLAVARAEGDSDGRVHFEGLTVELECPLQRGDHAARDQRSTLFVGTG